MKKLLLTFFLIADVLWAADHTKEAPNQEVLKNIQEAAKEGKPQAQFELGCLLSSGEYLPRNAGEAFRLFLESAKQGYSKAQYKVGMAYFNGEGILKNQKEGLAWIYLSILDGTPLSICQSMEASVGPQTVESAKQRSKDLIALLPKEIIDFIKLKEKAPGGDPETQYKLGRYYENRKIEPMAFGEAALQLGGVGQIASDDNREAIKWITKASDQGYAPAQNELGNLYSMNKVHAEDDKEVHVLTLASGYKSNSINWLFSGGI
jgi:TPR repeat protein